MSLEEEADELELLTRPGREEELRTFLRLLDPADVAELISEFPAETSKKILQHLGSERAADTLSELQPSRQDEVTQLLRPQELAPIVGEMETDDITDLLQEIDPKTAEAVLQALPVEEREEITELLRYEPDTAGGIMQMELVSVPVEATVASALESTRRAAKKIGIISVFVVDEDDRYVGNLALQDLVFSPAEAKVREVMTPKSVEIFTDLDQEQVAKIFDRYSLVEAGVVDKWGRLRGRITADDVHEVLVEEADEDVLVMAGAGSEPEVVYSNKIFKIVGVRLPWLLSTFCAGLAATAVLQDAQHVLGQMVVLLTFVPVITGMSGNVGTQSAMIMIRGLATGHIDTNALYKTVAKDLLVGALMALCCAIIVFGVVGVWQRGLFIGACVAISLFLSMVCAAFLGSVEPPLLKRFGVDPAIAAGPLITSINDVTGVLIYTSVVRALMAGVS